MQGSPIVNSQIKCKNLILKLGLRGYSDTYIPVKGTITVPSIEAAATAANNANKKVILKNCAPFTDCISESNNTQIDNARFGCFYADIEFNRI